MSGEPVLLISHERRSRGSVFRRRRLAMLPRLLPSSTAAKRGLRRIARNQKNWRRHRFTYQERLGGVNLVCDPILTLAQSLYLSARTTSPETGSVTPRPPPRSSRVSRNDSKVAPMFGRACASVS